MNAGRIMPRPMKSRLARCTFLAVIASALLAQPAQTWAAPDCPHPVVTPHVLLSGMGQLESVIVDTRGRIFFTDLAGNRLLRLDAPGAQPKVLASINSPGGMAFADDGNLVVGYGNNTEDGNIGDQLQLAGLVEVNPDTGAATVLATGLGMANGVTRDPTGAYYGSNDFGSNIDRVFHGKTTAGWAKVKSGNGEVVDSSGRYLYVSQTFQPAAIQRVDIAHPNHVETYVKADQADTAAGPDGLTRDAADNIYVAANGAGQIWRVDRARKICVLASGLSFPSMVVFGAPSRRFSNRNLYAVGFGGSLLELPNVTTAPPPVPMPKVWLRIHVSISPKRAVTRKRTVFHILTSVMTDRGRRPLAGALVRFAGMRKRTDSHGRATVVRRFAHSQRVRARAVERGYRSGVSQRVVVHQSGR
jgi:sugar lactone lactonase YvrE